MKLKLLALLAVFTLFAAACGDDDSDAGDTSAGDDTGDDAGDDGYDCRTPAVTQTTTAGEPPRPCRRLNR